MQPPDAVIAADKVTAHYGRWPDFHDMEVVSVQMDRRGPDAPWVEFCVSAWAYTGRLTSSGHYGQHLPALVRFRCELVTNMSLEGFNHQNVLDGVDFGVGRHSPVRVALESIYGVGGFIECGRVRVVDVVPVTPTPGP